MRSSFYIVATLCFVVLGSSVFGQTPKEDAGKPTVRFATFNISFHRKSEGALKKKLATGKGLNFSRIAEMSLHIVILHR